MARPTAGGRTAATAATRIEENCSGVVTGQWPGNQQNQTGSERGTAVSLLSVFADLDGQVWNIITAVVGTLVAGGIAWFIARVVNTNSDQIRKDVDRVAGEVDDVNQKLAKQSESLVEIKVK